MAGKTHPMLMGRPFELAFPEIWNDIRGVFLRAETSKVSVDVNEIPLMVERGGYKEESYFTGNFNPVRHEDGTVGGFYNSVGSYLVYKIFSFTSDYTPNLNYHSSVFSKYPPHFIDEINRSSKLVSKVRETA